MSHSHKPTAGYWLIGVLMTAWNGLGVMAYIQRMTLTPAAVAALPDAERTLLQATPTWATAAFAIAVFGGTAGCLLLLLRSRWAIPVLALSLLGVLVQLAHAFLIANSYEVYGPGGLIMPIMVVAGAVFLVWFALRARKCGWLH